MAPEAGTLPAGAAAEAVPAPAALARPVGGGIGRKAIPTAPRPGSEWPRARTDAATGGIGGGPGPYAGSARTGALSGPSDNARGGPPGRAKTRGQKAGAGGNPAAARRVRTWRRRLAVMLQCRCALRRTTSVGSLLEGLPLTRFLMRGRGARRHRPRRTTPRRSSRRRRLGRPGKPGRWFPRRGRTRRCPAECPRRWLRPAAEARPASPRPEAGAAAARDRGRSGAPPRRRAKRARAHGLLGTERGTPTPSDLSGHKRSRPPADAAPVSKRTC